MKKAGKRKSTRKRRINKSKKVETVETGAQRK